jgi:hypothetical protein
VQPIELHQPKTHAEREIPKNTSRNRCIRKRATPKQAAPYTFEIQLLRTRWLQQSSRSNAALRIRDLHGLQGECEVHCDAKAKTRPTRLSKPNRLHQPSAEFHSRWRWIEPTCVACEVIKGKRKRRQRHCLPVRVDVVNGLKIGADACKEAVSRADCINQLNREHTII